MRIAVVSAAVLAVTAIASPSASADFEGNVNFFLGAKSLNSNDWSPNDSQVAFGAVMSFGMKDWPVQIAGDVLVSVDETTAGSVKTTGATFEFDPGIRWLILKKGTVVPYIGGGVGIIGGEGREQLRVRGCRRRQSRAVDRCRRVLSAGKQFQHRARLALQHRRHRPGLRRRGRCAKRERRRLQLRHAHGIQLLAKECRPGDPFNGRGGVERMPGRTFRGRGSYSNGSLPRYRSPGCSRCLRRHP